MLRGRTLDPAEVAFFSDLQRILSKKPKEVPARLSRICGVDAAYDGDRIFAVASLFESRRPSKEALCAGRCTMPYASGLFYLREGPFVVEAVRRLEVRPDLICFDAHGAAHPRSAGLATICGMILGIPSLGVAKSKLIGSVSGDTEVGTLVHLGRTVGFVTKAPGGSKRYWSPGYSLTLSSLRRIMKTEAQVCLQAIALADLSAKRARSSGAWKP